MMDRLIVVFAVCVVSVSATFNFTLNDCLGNQTNALIRINNVSLSPSIIHLPRQESGYIDMDVLRTIQGTRFHVSVKFSKELFGGFIDIPCTGGYGSCDYDLCTALSQMSEDSHGVAHCPPQLTQHNFPCTCPINAGHYSIPPVAFQLHKLNPIYSAMASGDFKIHIKITDTKRGDHVGCFDIKATLDTGCTGLACIGIGRK